MDCAHVHMRLLIKQLIPSRLIFSIFELRQHGSAKHPQVELRTVRPAGIARL